MRITAGLRYVCAFAERRDRKCGASGDGGNLPDVASQKAGNGPHGCKLHPFLPHGREDLVRDRCVKTRTAERLIEFLQASSGMTVELTVGEALKISQLFNPAFFVHLGGNQANAAQNGPFSEA